MDAADGMEAHSALAAGPRSVATPGVLEVAGEASSWVTSAIPWPNVGASTGLAVVASDAINIPIGDLEASAPSAKAVAMPSAPPLPMSTVFGRASSGPAALSVATLGRPDEDEAGPVPVNAAQAGVTSTKLIASLFRM